MVGGTDAKGLERLIEPVKHSRETSQGAETLRFWFPTPGCHWVARELARLNKTQPIQWFWMI